MPVISNLPLLRIETPPRTGNSVSVRAFFGILVPASLDVFPNISRETTVFDASGFLWSLPLSDHQNSRFVPHVTKWQLSGEDLDAQHREREDIGPFCACW